MFLPILPNPTSPTRVPKRTSLLLLLYHPFRPSPYWPKPSLRCHSGVADAESRYSDGASDLSSEARSAKEEATKNLLPRADGEIISPLIQGSKFLMRMSSEALRPNRSQSLPKRTRLLEAVRADPSLPPSRKLRRPDRSG